MVPTLVSSETEIENDIMFAYDWLLLECPWGLISKKKEAVSNFEDGLTFTFGVGGIQLNLQWTWYMFFLFVPGHAALLMEKKSPLYSSTWPAFSY